MGYVVTVMVTNNQRGGRSSRPQQQQPVVVLPPKQKGKRNQRSHQRMESFRHEKSTYNDNLYHRNIIGRVEEAVIRRNIKRR